MQAQHGHQLHWRLEGQQARMSLDGPIRAVAQHQQVALTGLTSRDQAQEQQQYQKCGHSLPTLQVFRLQRTLATTQKPMSYSGAGITLVPLQQLHSSAHLAITPTLRQALVHNQVLSQAVLSSTDKVQTPVLQATSRSTPMAMEAHSLHRRVLLAPIPVLQREPLVAYRQVVLRG